jgi:hypothetical protein
MIGSVGPSAMVRSMVTVPHLSQTLRWIPAPTE